MTPDVQLWRCYAEDGSEAAFAALVSRHVGLVYATALRLVGGDALLGGTTARLGLNNAPNPRLGLGRPVGPAPISPG